MGIEHLKITTLADNLVMIYGLQGQWGLSFFLELVDAKGKSRKLVFDTGNDYAPLMHNINYLKLDLSEVDCIVLSQRFWSMALPNKFMNYLIGSYHSWINFYL